MIMNIFDNENAKPAYVIAEIGINHNGHIDKAFKLIDQAKECGADAVKFQTFKTELLILKDQPKMPYQIREEEKDNQFEMLKTVELNKGQHIELIRYCKEKEIDFISTAYDNESVDLLVELGVEAIKIASTDTTNIPLLRYIKKLEMPMILSTGVTSLDELKRVMEEFEGDYKEKVALLHCVSNYPAPLEELNLNCIESFKTEFGCPVGFSDHSASLTVGAYAVCCGAGIIEKHFTFDKQASGPGHAASVTADELKVYIEEIKNAEKCFGDGIKKVMNSEKEIKLHMQKSIVAKIDLVKGDVLCDENLWTMRPATGLSPLEIDSVVGKKLNKQKSKFEQILREDLEIA